MFILFNTPVLSANKMCLLRQEHVYLISDKVNLGTARKYIQIDPHSHKTFVLVVHIANESPFLSFQIVLKWRTISTNFHRRFCRWSSSCSFSNHLVDGVATVVPSGNDEGVIKGEGASEFPHLVREVRPLPPRILCHGVDLHCLQLSPTGMR